MPHATALSPGDMLTLIPEEEKHYRDVATLPSSSPPPENVESLKDNIRSEVSNSEVPKKCVDKKISTLAERQTENKRKFENTSRNSQNQQQQQIKRQNTGRAYTTGSDDKKPYGGSKPLCSKVREIPKLLTTKCSTVTIRRLFAMELGIKGTTKRDCPEAKKQSHKNQIEGTRAHGVVHTLRGGETDQGPNNIKDGIEA
ncbi:hypothetical protein Tco_0091644 [Tanacetum coccineum]